MDLEGRVVSHRPDVGSSVEPTSRPVVDESLVTPNGHMRSAATGVPGGYFSSESSPTPLRTILDSFPHLVWTTNATGQGEYYNYGWQEYTGKTEAELLGKGILSVVHPDDRKIILKEWKHSVEAGRPMISEVRIQGHDGEFRTCTVRANPLLNETGKIERWIGTTTDIHDQQNLEAERLRLLEQNLKQREHLHGIIHNVPGVVWEAWNTPNAAKQQVDFVSPQVETMIGYSEAEWLATSDFWLTIVHPEDRERASATARAIYEAGGSGVNKFRWLTKSGRVLWVEAYASVLFDEDGQPAGMCGVSIDITERQLAEEERQRLANRVEEERARMHRVINAVPGIVWEMAPTAEASSLSYVSEQLRSLTGYTGEDIRRGVASEIISHEDFGLAVKTLQNLGTQREATFDITLRHAAGHTVVLESHAVLSGEPGQERLNGVSFDVTHERLLQRTARRGEQLLQAIAQNLPAVLCYIDREERYRFSNRAHQQLWGKTPDQILGRTVLEVSGAAVYDFVHARLLCAFAGHEQSYVLPLQRADGLLYFESTLLPQVDDSGEVSGVILLSQDITERVKAEHVIKRSEEQLRAIAANSPSLLWLCDDRGLRFFFNDRWYEYTGTTPEENLGDGWQSLLDARDLNRFLAAYANAISTQTQFQIEYRLHHHSGEERWILSQAQPRFSDEGEFLGLIGSCTDISVQKQAEIAILRSHEHFRQLAESMPHIIWAARPDGTGEYWNRFWFDYTGLTEEQCQRPVLREGVFHPQDLKEAIRQWKNGIAAETAIEFPIRIRRASDGEYRWHVTRTVPVRDAAGRMINWVGSVIDVHDQRVITDELRVARDEADAANRAKDHFLATLSHELRTPLTPVLTTIETLELDEHIPPAIEAHIATIRRNVELEARLIDDLLDLTRITRGKIHLTQRPVEVHGLLANVLEICRRDISAKRIDIHLGLHAQRTYINADPARLQQILWNVLQNAVKFTPAEGKISLRTEDRSDTLRIVIADTGIGIDPERLTQIFRPFEQGNVEITKQFGGLGLGLAISKMLVDMQNGSIVASSEGLNCGSSFILEFPVTEAPEQRPEGVVPARRRHTVATGQSILLVDDHPDTALSVKILLERRGYKVTVAHSVNQALESFNAAAMDLVISDIGLPDGSGWELIEELHKKSPVQAIALSGFCTDQDIERSRKAGFSVHLTKPFNFNDLHREIQTILDEADQQA